MAVQHSTVANAFEPTDYGALLLAEIQARSTAVQATSLYTTGNHEVAFPIWNGTTPPSWVGELETIPEVSASNEEITATPKKVASLLTASDESIADSNPDLASIIGTSLANQIAQSVDAAFVGTSAGPKQPEGLLDVSGVQSVSLGGSALADTDPFIEAVFLAETAGASLSSFIVSPDTAKALAQLKTADASNQHLLDFTAGGLTVAGRPIITNDAVDNGTIAWGVDRTRVKTVMRKTATVERFPLVEKHGWHFRGVARVAFGFLQPDSIIQITAA